jgi:hypothetical protein
MQQAAARIAAVRGGESPPDGVIRGTSERSGPEAGRTVKHSADGGAFAPGDRRWTR